MPVAGLSTDPLPEPPSMDSTAEPLLMGTLSDLVRVNLAMVRTLAELNHKVDLMLTLATRDESQKASQAAALGAGDYN